MNRKPERIAYIIGKMWAGGVESCVFNYYRAIDKTKYQFDFYYDADSTVDPPADLLEMGARFYKLPPYQHLIKYIGELRDKLKQENYKVVHSHLNTLSVFPLYASWRAGIPMRIAHNHSVPGGNEWKRNAMKYALRLFSKTFATKYCACSEKAGRWLFGNRSFNSGQVTVLRNAIDYTVFCPDEAERNLIRKELGIENNLVVGHIGRFTYAKNHDLLIAAFAKILEIRDNAVLLLVGDGELHDHVIDMLCAYGVEDKTILTGKTSDTSRYYRAVDVMILPSRFEGLSMTTVEALACDIPCVISEAIPDEALISDNYTYISLSDLPEKWAQAAVESVGQKGTFNEKKHEYDIIKAVKVLEQLYDALIGFGGGISM